MTHKRAAVYGGSFDPPHLGHVLAVAWALSTSQIDEVWVIPTWKHAFDKTHGAPFDARNAMCKLAFAPFRSVTVLDVERELGGVSRTLDTLQELRSRHPKVELRLLVGADVLPTTHRWHRWDDVVQIAPPLVVGREGYPPPEACPIFIPNVSSTDVRDALDESKSVDGWVPAAVVSYIHTHALYMGGE